MEINQIYSELIREHSLHSTHKHNLEGKTHSQLGVNPSCGDEIILNLKINNNIIEDASYEGMGCAISQASTSMMIDVIKGETLENAKSKVDTFLKMIKNEEIPEIELDKLEDAIVLESVNKLPARVKCAVLAWRTLDKILEKK